MRYGVILLILCSFLFANDAKKVERALFDDTMLRLEGAIRETIRRQTIYAHNISNADVPNYKPIRFAEEKKEIESRPGFTEDKVIVEEEMAKITKNKFKHQTFLRIYNMKMQTLKKVITQGKG